MDSEVYNVQSTFYKVSSTEHPPAFPSFLKRTTELLSPQAPASPSSLPSLPPTHPLPFRAPLRPVRSLNEPPVPLPPTLSSSFSTFPTLLPSAPSSYTFLPSLQGLPAPTPNTASPRRPLRPSPDASTNPPPHSLPCSPLSCPRSNLTLAFVPSSQVVLYKWESNHAYGYCSSYFAPWLMVAWWELYSADGL